MLMVAHFCATALCARASATAPITMTAPMAALTPTKSVELTPAGLSAGAPTAAAWSGVALG